MDQTPVEHPGEDNAHVRPRDGKENVIHQTRPPPSTLLRGPVLMLTCLFKALQLYTTLCSKLTLVDNGQHLSIYRSAVALLWDWPRWGYPDDSVC